jgi:hypothetical protein
VPGWTEHYCQTVERGALAAGAEVDSSSSDTRIDSLCSISRSEILSVLTEAGVQSTSVSCDRCQVTTMDRIGINLC